MNLLHFDYSNLRQVFLQAIVIVCFGIATGLMFNYPLLRQTLDGAAPSDGGLVSEPLVEQGPQTVELEDVERLHGQAIRIDARIPELYVEGHLPGALSLPYAEVDAHLDVFMAQVAKTEQIIIYCAGYGCPDSFDLATLLLAEGYQDVSVFAGGYPQWRDSDKPVEAGRP